VRDHPGQQADAEVHHASTRQSDAAWSCFTQEHRAQQDREQNLGGVHRFSRTERDGVVAHHASGLEKENRRNDACTQSNAGREPGLALQKEVRFPPSPRLPVRSTPADWSRSIQARVGSLSIRSRCAPSAEAGHGCQVDTGRRSRARTPTRSIHVHPMHRARASRYNKGAHNMPATTVAWKLPATSHDGPPAAAKLSSM
jgi:hypothetical protein